MSARECYEIHDCETYKVVHRNGQVTEIHPGRIYKILPLNKNKKRNVDRRCMVIAFSADFMSFEVHVRFIDTYRESKADIRELVEG